MTNRKHSLNVLEIQLIARMYTEPLPILPLRLLDSEKGQRYTNADLKISLCIWVNIKTIPWKFVLLIVRIHKLFAHDVCKFLKK